MSTLADKNFFANIFIGKEDHLAFNSWKRVLASLSIALLGFALTFFVLPVFGLRLHFFQYSIILNALLFGPFAGLATGALTSSYTSLFIMHNPFIIGGNALLGLLTALFARKLKPFYAVIAAFILQVPYIVLTDLYVGMPLPVVSSILAVLAVEIVVCAVLVEKTRQPIKAALA